MSTHSVPNRQASAALIVALLAVELVDELVFGVRNAAWPMMRTDLRLTYEQIGALLTIPTVFGSLVEPAIGILGDTWRRRPMLLAGGAVFTASLLATAAVHGWIALLVAFALFNPASGAFVGLSQATLMDLAPERQEQNMARWVVAGSIGVAGGTALIGLITRLGGSWRAAFVVLAVVTGAVVAVVARIGAARIGSVPTHASDVASLAPDARAGLRNAIRALRRPDVRRWLILLECSDLIGDVLAGFLALYLVDVAHASTSQAVLGVALFTGVGLGGDALLVPVLERVDGLRYLRASVLATLVVFPALLLTPSLPAKMVLISTLGLLNSGWYSIPKARLYAAMPGQSGAVIALANTFGLVAAFVPLAIGAAAERVGLGPTMWVLLLGPVALLVGLPPAKRDS